jgi:AAA15 family ATPase/GTPase
MLLSYSAKNYYCFKEGIEVSFELGKSCPPSISNNKEFSTVLCVKGANGAGKSNALKALEFISNFCKNSFSLKPDDPLNYKPFYNSKDTTDFSVTFKVDKIKYTYDLSLLNNEVIKESIKRKKLKEVTLFERDRNILTNYITSFKELKKIKLRSNASIISTAHQYEIKNLKFIYDFFSKFFISIDAAAGSFNNNVFNAINSFYYEQSNLLEFAKCMLKKCDLGIQDVIIKKIDIDENKKRYATSFVHEYNGELFNIPFEDESKGTRNLYKQLFLYKLVLDGGGVLVLDEFDINLHPDILPLLVDLFTDTEKNPNDAQLLFTTHNSAILDILGKYRAVMVNKENNESYLYRVDEIKSDLVRNDRPLAPIYNSGKIGGVPKV